MPKNNSIRKISFIIMLLCDKRTPSAKAEGVLFCGYPNFIVKT